MRDLAEWTLLTIENRDVGIFNATGPAKPLTMKDMLEACKQASGSDATFTWADAAFLEKHDVRAWMDMPVWVPPTGEMAGMSAVSNARAVAGTEVPPHRGHRPRHPRLVQGAAPGAPGGAAEARRPPPEREREVLAAWHQQQAGAAPAP